MQTKFQQAALHPTEALFYKKPGSRLCNFELTSFDPSGPSLGPGVPDGVLLQPHVLSPRQGEIGAGLKPAHVNLADTPSQLTNPNLRPLLGI